MDPAILQQIPNTYKKIYRQNWRTIKTSIKLGVLKDVYHFPLLTTANGEIVSRLQEMAANYADKIKVNVAFGFILQERTTGELKFFHPSNNTMLFEAPRVLANPNDFHKLVEDIENQDAVEYARSQRPSTKWTVERIICVRFDVYKCHA